MTENEKRAIAIHEAGHASVSWLLQYANPLVKVTIVPRGQALGAAWYLPEERTITTREQMLDEICSLLGGRAAEELFTGHVSSGALNDLERVTKRIYGMVAYLGMSENSRMCATITHRANTISQNPIPSILPSLSTLKCNASSPNSIIAPNSCSPSTLPNTTSWQTFW